jgi:transposase-like protein
MRKKRTSEEMERVLLDFDQSGQRVRDYCVSAGLAEHLLRYWLRRREKGRKALEATPAHGFSELKIRTSGGGITLVLPHGLRLELESVATKELAGLLLELDRQRHA